MQARSRQRDLFAVIAVTLVVVLAGTTLAQSSTPTNIGTWKLNFAKSKALSPDNGPASVSSTITSEAAGVGVRCTVAVVSAMEGTLNHFEFSGKYDGKDNTIKGSTQYGDVVALTRVDANTTRYIYKKGGTVTVTQTHVVSSDGKTMTVTSAGTDAKGTPINSVAVYDKQ